VAKALIALAAEAIAAQTVKAMMQYLQKTTWPSQKEQMSIQSTARIETGVYIPLSQ